MHLLTDENGNVIAHGHEHNHEHTHADGTTHSHDHDHHHEHGHGQDHEHTHEHPHGHHHHHDDAFKKTDALLGYMVDHNAHHAEELKEMADTLRGEGREAVADVIEEAIAHFAEGNKKLSQAMDMIR